MSIVVARVKENGYEMASDSILITGFTQDKGARTSHSKMFSVNGMDIGGVGVCKEISWLKLYSATTKPAEPTESAVLEWYFGFIDFLKKKLGKEDIEIENNYLLGYGGKVFQICDSFVDVVKTFSAIGAGADFALAALHLGHSAAESVKVACDLSIQCEEPVVLITR